MASPPPPPSPTGLDSRGPVAVLRAVVAAVRNEDVTFLAAGIAYYAFVSLVPLLLLALGVASLVGGDALADRVILAADELLTPEAQQLVRASLVANAAAGGASLVGFAVLTWSGLKLFRGLDKAFSQLYGTSPEGGLVAEIRDGLVVLAAIGLGTLAVGVAGGAVSRLLGVARLAAPLLSVAVLVVAFLPLYYVFPDTAVTVRGVLPGTVVAALGWSVLGSVFGVYAAVAGGSVYGVLGAALLVVTWLYLGALIVMLGAVVNVTLTGPAETDAGDPDPGADRQVQHAGASAPATAMPDDGDSEEGDASGGEVEREIDRERSADDGTAPADAPPTGPARPDEDGAGPASSPADRPTGSPEPVTTDAETAEELAALRTDLERLREQLDETDERLDERTVSRSDLEADLRQYVRSRVRRGHARGWGPYLVLLYGTAMTLGAFFYLEGIWAIAAMLVVWLSTLGLYALMVIVGTGIGLLSALSRARDLLGSLR